MTQMVFEVVTIIGLSGCVSIAALLLWARLAPDPDMRVANALRQSEAQTIFLFDGLDLVDCTPPARQFMNEAKTGGNDLTRLLRALSSRFDTLPGAEMIREEALEGEFLSKAKEDDLKLILRNWNGYLRVTLSQASGDDSFTDHADMTITQADELVTLQAVADEAPLLIWQTDFKGEITWANEAYFAEIDARDAGERSHWPPARLFPGVHVDPPPSHTPRRTELQGGETTVSYDVHCVERGDRRLYFGLSADAAVRAERTQDAFIQTLTKTFAHLSIGLAIFDRSRRMVLFNPALLDLLGLPIDFFLQKPTLHFFLDRLREERLIAEPKNYKAWRKQIVELEDRALDGSYCETWNLPNGVTFRVTGRPHPDGAIAFLFEDISAEMSLTRRFNAEIELSHAALDAVSEAILLINNAGVVAFTNKAYKEMWQNDPGASLVVTRVQELATHWREVAGDSPVWNNLIAAVERRASDGEWQGHVSTRDGRFIACRTEKLYNGAMLVGFNELKRHQRPRGVAAS